MAYPVLQSSTVATANGGPAPAIPSGLAVGDLMVGYVVCYGGGSAPSAPSGSWTTARLVNSGSSPAFGLFWKVADSTDVLQSTFSFGGGTRSVGILMRITGADPTAPVDAINDGTGSTTSLSSSGITPLTQDLLLLCGGAGKNNNGGSMAFSSPAIANSNPSWSQVQTGRATDTGNDASGVVYQANMTGAPTSGTGTATMTVGFASSTDLMVVAIRPTRISPALFGSTFGILSFVVNTTIVIGSIFGSIFSVLAPTLTTTTIWTRSQKNSDSWTTQNRSTL